jgi:hypothetical protein
MLPRASCGCATGELPSAEPRQSGREAADNECRGQTCQIALVPQPDATAAASLTSAGAQMSLLPLPALPPASPARPSPERLPAGDTSQGNWPSPFSERRKPRRCRHVQVAPSPPASSKSEFYTALPRFSCTQGPPRARRSSVAVIVVIRAQLNRRSTRLVAVVAQTAFYVLGARAAPRQKTRGTSTRTGASRAGNRAIRCSRQIDRFPVDKPGTCGYKSRSAAGEIMALRAFWSRSRSRPENGLGRRFDVGGNGPRADDCWQALRAPPPPEKPDAVTIPAAVTACRAPAGRAEEASPRWPPACSNAAPYLAPPNLALRVLF